MRSFGTILTSLEEGVPTLEEMIKKLEENDENLTELDLSKRELTDVDAERLGKALKNNTRLVIS